MLGKTESFFAILLTLTLLLCVINVRVVCAGNDEDDIQLKRGPRMGDGAGKELDDEVSEDDDDDEFGDEEEEEPEAEPVAPGQTLGTINFSTPDLDDEAFHSPHLPTEMKCDACNIMAFMITERFDKANKKRPSLNKKLPESDIIDIMEQMCADEFSNVGVKEINGKNRLSGPGSKIADTPGIMQGGGKWPFRMMQMCNYYVGEYGEDEIYELYLEGKLAKKLCYSKGGACKDKKKTKKDEKKKGGNKKQKSKKTKSKKNVEL